MKRGSYSQGPTPVGDRPKQQRMSRARTRTGRGKLVRLTGPAALVGLFAAVLFAGRPEIDLVISRQFVTDSGGFIFNYPGLGQTLRTTFNILFWGLAGLSLSGVFIAAVFWRNLFTLSFPKWLFIALCLILGPGITANTLLKDNWGRARPLHVEEFGGTRHFTPVLVRSDQCQKNCSFVAGEASSIYMLFFSLALLARRRRNGLLTAGLIGGTAAGLVRVAQGGHFLSDVIFAGVFMALVAEVVYWAVFVKWREPLRESGRVQTSLAAGSRKMITAAWNALESLPGNAGKVDIGAFSQKVTRFLW